MAFLHDAFKGIKSYQLSTGSAAATSTATAFGAQTQFCRLVVVDAVGSNTGVWYSTDTTTVTSATGTYLSGGWVEIIKVSPSQKVTAVGNAATNQLNITELSD